MKHRAIYIVFVLIIFPSGLFGRELDTTFLSYPSRYKTAMNLLNGVDCDVDVPQALSILEDLCKHNYVRALRTWGTMHVLGVGVEVDMREAYIAYRKAASLGDAHSISNLATMYRKGDYVEQDFKKAYKLYLRALKYGDRSANYYLGYLRHKGFGVKQSYKKALEYYLEGARYGMSNCLYMLGYFHIQGYGVEADIVKGKELMEKAIRKGSNQASDFLIHDLLGYHQRRAAPRNPNDPLEMMLPVRRHVIQKDTTNKVDFTGSWDGILVEYDWSGARIERRSSLSLVMVRDGDCVDGTWIIDGEPVSFNACYADSTWSMDAEIHHNASGALHQIKSCRLKYVANDTCDYLCGNLFIHHLKYNEPVRPNYIVLKRESCVSSATTNNTLLEGVVPEVLSIEIDHNPIIDDMIQLSVSLPQDNTLFFQIFDNSGRCVQKEQQNMTAGYHYLHIPFHGSSGVYVLEVLGKGIHSSYKFIQP